MADGKGIRAGRAYVELGVDDRVAAGLAKAKQRLLAFGAAVERLGLRVFAGGAAVLTPMLAAVKSFAASGSAIYDMAARTGLTAEAVSELGYAAEQSGGSMEGLEKGVRVMQRTIGEAAGGTQTAVDALQRLGLSAEELLALAPDQQFTLIGDRLSRIADPALRTAAAMEVFGRSGTELLPMLAGGARGIEELRAQARALGLTVSTETAAKADLLGDTLDSLWRVLKDVTFEIGAALAPTMTALAQSATRVFVTISRWIQENQRVVVTVLAVAAGVTALGGTLVAIGLTIKGLAFALGGLRIATLAVGGVLKLAFAAIGALLSPIGLVIAGVAALGVAVLSYTGAAGKALDWLGSVFGRLGDFVGRVVGGIANALRGGDLALAGEILWTTLKLVWQTGIGELQRLWHAAQRWFAEAAFGAWYGLKAAVVSVMHGIEVAWIETTSFLAEQFKRITTSLRQIWTAFRDWLGTWWLKAAEFAGLMTPEETRAAIAQLEADSAGEIQGLEAGKNEALRGVEERRQAARAAAQADFEASMADIGADFEEVMRGVRVMESGPSPETVARLAELREKLQAALQRAENLTMGPSEALPPTPARAADPYAELAEGLGDVGFALGRVPSLSTAGTFNPAALWGLGPTNPAERTARATEESAKRLKRLEELVAQRRGVFAP